jgi:hypothetical protein
MKVCPNCGKEYSSSAVVCAKDGTRLVRQDKVLKPQPALVGDDETTNVIVDRLTGQMDDLDPELPPFEEEAKTTDDDETSPDFQQHLGDPGRDESVPAPEQAFLDAVMTGKVDEGPTDIVDHDSPTKVAESEEPVLRFDPEPLPPLFSHPGHVIANVKKQIEASAAQPATHKKRQDDEKKTEEEEEEEEEGPDTIVETAPRGAAAAKTAAPGPRQPAHKPAALQAFVPAEKGDEPKTRSLKPVSPELKAALAATKPLTEEKPKAEPAAKAPTGAKPEGKPPSFLGVPLPRPTSAAKPAAAALPDAEPTAPRPKIDAAEKHPAGEKPKTEPASPPGEPWPEIEPAAKSPAEAKPDGEPTAPRPKLAPAARPAIHPVPPVVWATSKLPRDEDERKAAEASTDEIAMASTMAPLPVFPTERPMPVGPVSPDATMEVEPTGTHVPLQRWPLILAIVSTVSLAVVVATWIATSQDDSTPPPCVPVAAAVPATPDAAPELAADARGIQPVSVSLDAGAPGQAAAVPDAAAPAKAPPPRTEETVRLRQPKPRRRKRRRRRARPRRKRPGSRPLEKRTIDPFSE